MDAYGYKHFRSYNQGFLQFDGTKWPSPEEQFSLFSVEDCLEMHVILVKITNGYSKKRTNASPPASFLITASDLICANHLPVSEMTLHKMGREGNISLGLNALQWHHWICGSISGLPFLKMEIIIQIKILTFSGNTVETWIFKKLTNTATWSHMQCDRNDSTPFTLVVISSWLTIESLPILLFKGAEENMPCSWNASAPSSQHPHRMKCSSRKSRPPWLL